MDHNFASTLRMVDLKTQYDRIKQSVDDSIQNVLETTSYIRGPIVGEFECDFAAYLGARFVHGVANGTDALQIALMAIGVRPGDEVITSSFTFVATAEAAALLGAVPVFADIDPQTFNIDPSRIEELITPKTKAIIPVHLFGQPAQMDAILRIGEKHGIPVIEDNAQAVGSRYRGTMTGTMGHVSTFSFFPSKNLGCYGDGGAVVTQDESMYERMKLVANHGSAVRYHNEIVGINSRLDSIQAAVLSAKLPHLESYNENRKRGADMYDAALSGVANIETPFRDPDCEHVFHQYTLRVATGDGAATRNALASYLGSVGIPHAIYYPIPLHRLEVFGLNGQATCRFTDLTETDRAADEVLSLPMHSELTEEQVDYISASIASFMRSR